MNCCTPWGKCDRNEDCPVREAAHTKAAEKHFAPDYSNPGYSHTMLEGPKPTPRHILALDWLGNLPHKFGRWVDRTSAGRRFCLAVGGVAACALAALVVMR